MLGGMPSIAQTESCQVWRTPRAGSLRRLKLSTLPLGTPAPHEVQVDVVAIGLNFADIFACLGLYSATPAGAFIPGLECAGIIRATGSAVSNWQVGDRVMVLTRFGGYATRLNVDARYLWPVPAEWSLAEAAAYPVQALTAWYGLLPLGQVTADSVVLLHSAAGGVGLNALQALQQLRAKVIAVVGSESKAEWLQETQSLAAEQIVIRDRQFAHRLDQALTSLGAKGFDVIFDAVYGPVFEPGFKRLAPEGRYILYGAADFMNTGSFANPLRLAWRYLRRPRLDPLTMISQNRGLRAFNLIWLWDEVERLPKAMHDTLQLIPKPPLLGGHYPFEAAHEAMQTLQAGQTRGKLLLVVSEHKHDPFARGAR